MSTGQIALIKKDIYAVAERFDAVKVERGMVFEREAGFALQVLSGSEYAMKIALNARDSVMASVVNIAAIGISLNPAKKQAYLVPRDGRICLDISYMGLLDLAIQSGSIRWGQAELVYEADEFTLNDVDKLPTHKRQPFAKDRGKLVGVYVVVKTAYGDYLTTTMTTDEVFAIRDRSSAWLSFVAKKARTCPWASDEGEMVKKTVIKRAYKMWPKTDRLDTAVHYLNTEGGEGIDFTERTKGSGQPLTGALDVLDEDQLTRIRECAEKVRQGYANLGAEASADYIAEQGFDAEEEAGLWSLLQTESAMRAAIKSAQAAQRRLAA